MNPPGNDPLRTEYVNEGISAREVRAVFPDESVETMPTMVAVRKARALGLDLVLIAPGAEPPVAKAMKCDWTRGRVNNPLQVDNLPHIHIRGFLV